MFTHGNRLLGSLVGEMAARRHAEPRELYPLTSEPTGGPNAFLLPTGGRRLIWSSVITCVVEYVIDATKIDAFERFARRWMELVNLRGSTHHGYFLPAEGASDRALALFSFPASPDMGKRRADDGADSAAALGLTDELDDGLGDIVRIRGVLALERRCQGPSGRSGSERAVAVRFAQHPRGQARGAALPGVAASTVGTGRRPWPTARKCVS